MVPARPFFTGRPGRVRSRAKIWLFSSCVHRRIADAEHEGATGRVHIKAGHILELPDKTRIVRSLERL